MEATLFQTSASEPWAHVVNVLQPTSVTDTTTLVVAILVAAIYQLQGILWDRPDPHRHIYFERPQQQKGRLTNLQSPVQKNIEKKLSESNKRVVVFWASQSGTSERFAIQLAKEFEQRYGTGAVAADLSDHDVESISDISHDKLAIFILSTYGEGDPSDNAAGFWGWITHGLTSDGTLGNLNYAAFGLGNSNYKYYNRVVDVVVQALDAHGARQLLPTGKADDAEGSTEEDFLAWKDDLFQTLRTSYGFEEQPVEYVPTLHVVEDDSLTPFDLYRQTSRDFQDHPGAAASSSWCRTQPLPIKNASELFKASERNCVHMELDLSQTPEIHYKTGDHLAVWPTNPPTEVDLLLAALDLRGQKYKPISLRPIETGEKLQIPTPTTVQALFQRHLAICAPVSRTTTQGLARFAPTPEAKNYLLHLGQSRDDYSHFLRKTHLTIGRLLTLASPAEPWSQLPLSYVVENVPHMQPRFYSISSSSVLSPRRVAITVLVAADPLPENQEETVKGVASNHLLALSQWQQQQQQQQQQPQQGEKPVDPISRVADIAYNLDDAAVDPLHRNSVLAYVRKSKFKLPTQSRCPIVMVAAGTGLAPFRAFIAERARLHAMGKPIGEMMLFFGCRRPEEDYIYGDELAQVQAAVGPGLFKIVTAFSRVPGQDKVHVQQRVREYGGQVVNLIEEKGASFYICGRASMAREVGLVLTAIVQASKSWSDVEVKGWSEGLKKKGKWREDVWG